MNLSCGWHPTKLIKIGKTSVDAVELGYIVLVHGTTASRDA